LASLLVRILGACYCSRDERESRNFEKCACAKIGSWKASRLLMLVLAWPPTRNLFLDGKMMMINKKKAEILDGRLSYCR
jgi:hypothetical protein